MGDRTLRAAAGAVAGIWQYAIQAALSVAMAPIVLAWAGQEVLGAYAVLMQALGYVVLVDFGLPVVVLRYLSQSHRSTDESTRFTTILSISRTASLISNTIFAILCGALAIWLDHLLALPSTLVSQARLGLVGMAIWTLLRTPLTVYFSALYATQDMAVVHFTTMAGNLIRFCASVILLVHGFGLIGLLTANVLGELVMYGSQAYVFCRKHPHRPTSWRITDRPLLREMLVLGSQSFLISISVRLVFQTDNLVVGYLYGAVAASIYYTTQVPSFAACNVVWRVADSAFPGFNQILAGEQWESLRRVYCSLLRLTLIGALALALGIALFNEPVIRLWVGQSQYAGGLMTAALAVFVVGQILNHLSGSVMLSFGDLRLISVLSVFGGLANLLLSVVLGKRFGPQWVMVASVIVDLPGIPYLMYRALRCLQLPLARVLRESVLPACGAVLPCLILTPVIAVVPHYKALPLGLAISGFLIALSFGSWMFGLGIEEKRLIRGRLLGLWSS